MPHITLEGGIKVRTFVPPRPGFDPLIASPAELERHGFPARPDDPHHLARYRRVFGQLKHKFRYVQPAFRVNADTQHGPGIRRAEDGTETSPNWSGGVVFAPPGQSFKCVYGAWVVPNVAGPADQNQVYSCDSWVGIDGLGGSNDTCSAGVGPIPFPGGTTPGIFYAYAQWSPGPQVMIDNLPISPGDMVIVMVCTSGPTAVPPATAYFINRTTGVSTSFGFDAPLGTQFIGNCAEWIVSSRILGGQAFAFGDYGQVFFSVCEASLTNNVIVYGGTGDNFNLVDNGGNVVSEGLVITPAIIQCLYSGALPTA